MSIIFIFGLILNVFSSNFVETIGFWPCDNNVVLMKNINLQTKTWFGNIILRGEKRVRALNINMRLSAFAEIRLNNRQGRVTHNNRNWHITVPKRLQGHRDKIMFSVRGQADRQFPNIRSLTINGQNLCLNPKNVNQHFTRSTTISPPVMPIMESTTVTPETQFDIRFGEYEQENKSCGKKVVQHQGLITNGYPSQEGDWPWHAAIYHSRTSTESSYKCGGSLISPDTILTAAHCTIEDGHFLVPSRILVKLGLHNRHIANRHTQEFGVLNVIPYFDFSFDDLSHDIAILKLSTMATLTNYVRPICLWPKEKLALDNIVNHNGLVIGWGLNEEDNLTDILTQGEMPVVSLTTCLESNRDFFGLFLNDWTYCAGFRNGTSVCNGDSGGGMFFKNDLIWYIRGIVSLSMAREDKDVCNPKQYVIFTDVAKYLDWIESHLN